jgi:hypothetical protein
MKYKGLIMFVMILILFGCGKKETRYEAHSFKNGKDGKSILVL